MLRRPVLIPLVALLAAALIYSAWWFYTGRTALRMMEQWVQAQRAEGYSISHATPSLGGFPMRVVVHVPDVAANPPGSLWAVSSDGVSVSFAPWDFSTYDIDSLGATRLRSPAVPESRETPVEIQSFTGQYRYDQAARVQSGDLILRTLTGSLGFEAEEVALSGTRPFDPAATIEDNIAQMRIEAVGVTLPDGTVPLALSPKIDAALLSFDLFGPEPTQAASFARQLTQWQADGGLAEIREVAVVWQDLNLQGEGTVTLDDYTRPELSLDLRVAGLSKTAERFEAAGLIDRTVRQAIELGSNLLSFGSGNGGRIKLPISIQDGQFYLGPVAIGEVDPLLPGREPPKRLVPSDRVERALGEPALPPPPPTVSDETLNAQ